MTIFLWCVAAYVALGIGTAMLLSQTPYSDNGWLVIIALWPLFLFGLLFG